MTRIIVHQRPDQCGRIWHRAASDHAYVNTRSSVATILALPRSVRLRGCVYDTQPRIFGRTASDDRSGHDSNATLCYFAFAPLRPVLVELFGAGCTHGNRQPVAVYTFAKMPAMSQFPSVPGRSLPEASVHLRCPVYASASRPSLNPAGSGPASFVHRTVLDV